MKRKEIIQEISRLHPDFAEALEKAPEEELKEILKIAQRNILIKDKIVLIKSRLRISEQ